MARNLRRVVSAIVTVAFAALAGENLSLSKGLDQAELDQRLNGKHLFEKETFGGNGRTCQTCHSKRTGTAPAWPTCNGWSTRRTPSIPY